MAAASPGGDGDLIFCRPDGEPHPRRDVLLACLRPRPQEHATGRVVTPSTSTPAGLSAVSAWITTSSTPSSPPRGSSSEGECVFYFDRDWRMYTTLMRVVSVAEIENLTGVAPTTNSTARSASDVVRAAPSSLTSLSRMGRQSVLPPCQGGGYHGAVVGSRWIEPSTLPLSERPMKSPLGALESLWCCASTWMATGGGAR
jgi:hypothetical protein